MARYLHHQDEVKIYIDEDNDLILSQTDIQGDEYKIIIDGINARWFVELIESAIEDGYQEEQQDGMV